MAMEWTNRVQIRSKNAAGTVLKTWRAGTANDMGYAVSTDLGYDKEIAERYLPAVGAYRPYIVGWWATLVVTITRVDGNFQGHQGGAGANYDYLEGVIEDYYQGGYLEVGLHGAGGHPTGGTDTTADYARVTLESGFEPQKLDGKNVGLMVELEFKKADRQSTVPLRDGTTW